MAIDVIIPGTTPWVFTNAALAPGETVETAVDLNGRYMAIAEMASRGYVVGAQIQQASADVQADKERLAILQNFQAGRFDDLDFSNPEVAKSNTELLQSLGVDTTNPRYPQMATMTGSQVIGWRFNTANLVTEPVYRLDQPLTVKLPAITVDLSAVPWHTLTPASVLEGKPIEPLYQKPGDPNYYYIVRVPDGGAFYLAQVQPAPVTTQYLLGIPADPALKAQMAAQVDPAKLDAEIEKTIQISQGKQTYLQSLVTDYSTFYTTTGNMIQDYLKLLTSLVSRIG